MIRHSENWILVLFVAVVAGLIAGAYFVETAFASSNGTITAYVARDTDLDGLSDDLERQKYFTDPSSADTDGDGMPDGTEIYHGRSPRHAGDYTLMQVDSDGDHLIDAWELILGTDLMNPDSDGDLFLDGTEVAAGYDPLTPKPVKLDKIIEVSTSDLELTYKMGGRILAVVPVSTGKSWTPTPLGEFEVLDKIPSKHYAGPTWDYPNTKWNLKFTRKNGWNYYIHGAYWHDKFGKQPVSGGCVNVRYKDMEPLYWWVQHGTRVVIR